MEKPYGLLRAGFPYLKTLGMRRVTNFPTDLAIGRRLAIGNGVLTVEDEGQALARARRSEGDKGGFAARACLEMIALRRRLLGHGR